MKCVTVDWGAAACSYTELCSWNVENARNLGNQRI